jgi:uncharacterized protein YggE
MRNKFLLVSVLLVMSILFSACASEKPATPQTPRTLSVNGSAQASLTPDIAYISVGVHTENKSATESVDANNAQVQQIVDALVGKGVDAKDMLTTNFSISPQDEWSPDGQKIGTKFVVDNTIYITLRDISKIGDILGAAVEAGANNVYGIQFDVSDKTALLASTRQAAVENARKQAEELAQAAGVSLGEVQNISYYNSYPVPVYDMKGGTAMGIGGGGSVPISAGQMTLNVDVNIIYEIK